MLQSSNPRRTHRKRISALRLSADTTSTLPEYIPVNWQDNNDDQLHSDQPPKYPESAEEADEETDGDSHTAVSAPQPSPPRNLTHPRRAKRTIAQRRRQSNPASADPYLDSLLERSVHALEMSNTLLQSSISTQTSLSTILASDSPSDYTLEVRARGLSSRIRDHKDIQDCWADDLEDIRRGVERLFDDDSPVSRRHSRHSTEDSISCSLPTEMPNGMHPHQRTRRRPSLDLRKASESAIPHLRYSPKDRSHLIAPPPRALTQYVESTADPETITLPSTLGLRATSSSHSDRRPSTDSLHMHATPSSPRLTDRPLDPATPAYNMLSTFVHRASSSGSTTPSSSFTSSCLPNFMSRRRGSSTASTSTERGSVNSRTSPSRARPRKSPDQMKSDVPQSNSSSSRLTPKRALSPLPHRPMTPPTEESSSSSSDDCRAKLTVMSLRKILDDQAMAKAHQSVVSLPPERPRPPAFMPRTPAPVAEAGTSTATASISRLFTKATHSSSTRPPSPPRQSAMKHTPSATPTPSPSPTTLNIPEFFGVGVARALGSASSSGRSTPKRISFAELPESYTGSRPGGSSKLRQQRKARRRNRSSGPIDKGKRKDGEGGTWWSGWFAGATGAGMAHPHGAGLSVARYEERVEDRISRSWSGRMGAGFGPGVDEWAI